MMASECERMYATTPLLQPAAFRCLLTSASTRENQTRSPLLLLPAELRNRIYELAFPTAAVKVHPAWDDPKVYLDYDGPRGIIALLQTCRQINAEAMQFFLSTLTFDTEPCSLHGFTGLFGKEKAALVTSIIFKPSDIATWSGKGLELRRTHAIRSLKAVKHVHVLINYKQWSEYGIEWKDTMRELFYKPELEVTVAEGMEPYYW